MSDDDGRWERHFIEGTFAEVVAEVLLTQPPCSYVVITDGDHPDAPGAQHIILVPQWGIA